MTDRERQKNRELYLEDVSQAINNLTERCGGSLETAEGALPRELVVRQRDLFVHAGISGLMSIAILDRDHSVVETFDWILGYFISRGETNREERNQFVMTMLMKICDQIVKDYPHDEDQEWIDFLALLKLSLMVLMGHINIHGIRSEISILAAQEIYDQIEKMRRNAEKN